MKVTVTQERSYATGETHPQINVLTTPDEYGEDPDMWPFVILLLVLSGIGIIGLPLALFVKFLADAARTSGDIRRGLGP
jgi:hypothetical protein